MILYGLIGKSLAHSFSQMYFSDKFSSLNLRHHTYINFELNTIDDIKTVFNHLPELKGLNVTSPYKEAIIPFLNHCSIHASSINAVNTIVFDGDTLTGHNTDWIGFKNSFNQTVWKNINRALILGTGGASKAIQYALESEGIICSTVSSSEQGDLSYDQLDSALHEYNLIVNTTPLGTFPNIAEKPSLPYHLLQPHQLLYDLVYNPQETAFLKEGKKAGCAIMNGLRMLELQAEASWALWQKP